MHYSDRLAAMDPPLPSVPTAPLDLTGHLNRTTLARQGNPMKKFYKYFQIPGVINLAGGLPYAGYFPFTTLEADHLLPSPSSSTTSSSTTTSLPRLFSTPSPHLTLPKYPSSLSSATPDLALATSLQYSTSTGLPSLAHFIASFTATHIAPSPSLYNPGPKTILTAGSTDGMAKIVELLAEKGDTLLVEEYAYLPAVAAARPYGVGTFALPLDNEGIRVEGPGGLREVMENWDERERARQRPKMMYTVPQGHNPTGTVTGPERMKAIYEVCAKYQIVIIEDAPYWFLQYGNEGEGLVPSYLTLDTKGIVIRLDTFSKSIAPGCRLGWITAQPAIIDRLETLTGTTTAAPSGFVQALVGELVINRWGMEGWISWLGSLRTEYQARMEAMCDILSSPDNCEWITDASPGSTVVIKKSLMWELEFGRPKGGMFVWLKLHIRSHPAYKAWRKQGFTRADFGRRLWLWTVYNGKVLCAPGGMFMGDGDVEEEGNEEGWGRVRMCFAAVEGAEEVEVATRKWVEAVREFWELEVEKIRGIADQTLEWKVAAEVEGWMGC